MKIQEKKFDAIIIGAGGAGLRAALQLAQSNFKVAVLSKVYPTRSHTVSAQGGIAAALGNVIEDHWQWHMYDTINGSDYLGDQDAIEYMCENAPASVYELEHMGLPFSRLENGKIYQRAFGGHTINYGEASARRTCSAADRTGHAMVHTMYQKNLEAKTHFFNEWFAVDLVKDQKGGVIGVVAICIETGEIVFFKARATVLATGGAGRIYSTTSNAYINSGDGLGMVLRAGFPLQDMEFWQFHPTGIAGVGCLISEGVRGEGGYLLNKNGERFMERYSPHLKDLDCRDVVSRAIIMEILAGNGCGPEGDHVMLKVDHLGDELIKQRLPGIRELSIAFANVDPVKEPIPTAPTCHYMMGGIPTNINAQVLTQDAVGNEKVVPGLYAAGECACVSVHGANRLGTNSLLDLIVFGRAAGLHLQKTLRDDSEDSAHDIEAVYTILDRLQHIQDKNHNEDPAEIRRSMRETMQNNFGVFRDEKHMGPGLAKIKELSERLKHARMKNFRKVFNTNLIELLELNNLMDVAAATARCALNRTESRGAHSRYDYPERDDIHWLIHSLCYQTGQLSSRPVNLSPKSVPPFKLKSRESRE